MAYELTKEDKSGIIDSHLRNLVYSKYNHQISIVVEQSANQPNSEDIKGFNDKIAEIENKIQALLDTKAALE